MAAPTSRGPCPRALPEGTELHSFCTKIMISSSHLAHLAYRSYMDASLNMTCVRLVVWLSNGQHFHLSQTPPHPHPIPPLTPSYLLIFEQKAVVHSSADSCLTVMSMVLSVYVALRADAGSFVLQMYFCWCMSLEIKCIQHEYMAKEMADFISYVHIFSVCIWMNADLLAELKCLSRQDFLAS